MPLPTSVKVITQATGLTATNANSNWTYLPQRPAFSDTTNPAFPRLIVLTGEGILVSRGGASYGIPEELLCAVAATAVPALTWPPIISPQPSNTFVKANAATSFTSLATDELGLNTFQWQYSNGTNVAAAGVYTNVTTPTLNISNTIAAANLLYQCLVTNPSGTNVSNLVGTADLVTQPANAAVTHPASAYFTVNVVTAQPVTYSWAANNVPIVATGTALYANWTTANLNVGLSNGLNSTQYLCTITAGGVTVNSNEAVLTVA